MSVKLPPMPPTKHFNSDEEAMAAIFKLMDRTEWDSETLNQIAEIMWAAGYEVQDIGAK